MPLSKEASTRRGNSRVKTNREQCDASEDLQGVEDDWNKEVQGEVERDETGGDIVPYWDVQGFVLCRHLQA